MAKRTRKKQRRQRWIILSLSVVIGVVVTIISYFVPGAGLFISGPIFQMFEAGGYPFIFAISSCQSFSPYVCGPIYYSIPGTALDILFWSIIAYFIINFASTRRINFVFK